ncbi:MAG: response regulator [Planctomycetes bacterium]|nr:response regulator [Planctomycetota bacterium]
MKILVADDSAIMQRLLLRSLEKWNYDAVVAADGAEAWELFQQDRFPLVLTDWMMPGVDGLELIRRIRASQQLGYVYIILLTAKTEKEDLVTAMDAGADDFLSKPFDQQELRVRVREGERIIRLEQTLAEQNRRLRETQAALVQSEKLASLGQLAAGMAHEINNPIAYVANNLAVLRRDVLEVMDLLERYREGRTKLADADPALAAKIAAAEEECDLPWLNENLPRLFKSSLEGLSRVREIVSNLRDFARLDEAELDELDLNAALESTAKVLGRETAEKELSVELELAPIPKITGRPQKLNQVLYNLLLNAVQASEPQGRITLRTRQIGEGVVLEVEDRGCGIEPQNLSRVFEPFFTTRPIGRGTGLGLAISYGIVRDHGGAIEVESRPGEGSLFRVTLPVRPKAQKLPASSKTADGERRPSLKAKSLSEPV